MQFGWERQVPASLKHLLPSQPKRDPRLDLDSARYEFMVLSSGVVGTVTKCDIIVRCIDRNGLRTVHPMHLLHEVEDVTGNRFITTFNSCMVVYSRNGHLAHECTSSQVQCVHRYEGRGSPARVCPCGSWLIMRTWYPQPLVHPVRTRIKCLICGQLGHDSIYCCVANATVRMTMSVNRTKCVQAELQMLQMPLIAIIPSDDVTLALQEHLKEGERKKVAP